MGYDPRMVRFLQFALSGFFAGIGGGLYAITYEIVTFDALAAPLSANALLMAYIGGTAVFGGPILGAVLITLLQSGVSLMSNSWLVYVGVLFITMVIFAPTGIMGLIAGASARSSRAGRLRPARWCPICGVLVPGIADGARLRRPGGIDLVPDHRRGAGQDAGAVRQQIDVHAPLPWLIAARLPGRRRLLVAHGGARVPPRLGAADAELAAEAERWHDRRSRSALRDVSKAFGPTEIIRGVNLDIAKGERHAIIGPNGAGKTTLFNLISGRFPIVVGRDPAQRRSASTVCRRTGSTGMGLSRSFQITSIFHRLSVFENLRCALLWSMGYRYSFWTPLWRQRALNERTDAMLEELNLAARRDIAGGAAVLRRPARARDRHDDRRRRVGDPARRADRRHEQHRDRQRGGADPPGLQGQDAGDGRARHEGGVRSRRLDHGAGLWPGDRLGAAAGGARQRGGAGSLSRARWCRMMLEVSDLHAYYGQSHILHGVDLDVGEGEIVSLLGRNGVGRSTTCKAIMGLVPPQGTVRYRGRDIAGLRTDQVAHCGHRLCAGGPADLSRR